MAQPPGFVHPQFPTHVCKLSKSLYCLKQAPRAWYNKLHQFLFTVGFTITKTDVSLSIYTHGDIVAYLLVYVDDIVLTGNNISFIDSFVRALGSAFSIRDLGPLHYFLGVQVHRDNTGIWLSQSQYIHGILTRARMLHCKPLSTPMATNVKLYKGDSSSFVDPSLYRQHTKLVAFFISKASNLQLQAFPDSQWAGSIDDRKSTGGYAICFGPKLISSSSKKQRTVARSYTESEYKAFADAAAELTWIQSLMLELGIHLSCAPILWCDNIGSMYLSINPIFTLVPSM
uniref:Uncharacterized mitochondrial protein AtMg00810-like n=1 Tax=Nicotiana tabacum TaxID=4097 RepID=A0A1S3Z369_TOBAC|nr:PREDICTED: uncharacterized mitochondrial protein AtMg00810-like [Nicotiana tabacum]